MASAYSTPKNFDNYIQPINTELVNFVLQSKQQKFDYNVAKLEQTLSEFGNFGLIRNQDKQYLADRVGQMIDGMGDLSSVDFSNNNLTTQVQMGIRGAIDDKVLKDISNSQKYSAYNEQVQKIREEDPEKYSDVNYTMGLVNAGADKWINGESDDMGNLQYTPYQDVKAQMSEVVKEYTKTHGTKQMVAQDRGDGVTIYKEMEVLSPETIRGLYDSRLTADQKRQLQMEADYFYGSADAQQQQNLLSQYNDSLRSEVKLYKDKLESKKIAASKLTGRAKEQAQAEIQAYQNNIETLEGNIGKVDYRTAYQDGHAKSIREGLVKSLAYERVTDIEKDMTDLKVLKMKADIAKTQSEIEASQAEVNGQNLNVLPDGGIDTEGTIVENFATQTRNNVESSINNMVGVFNQESNTDPNKFKELYGIEASEYNKKNQEEKIKFVSQQMDFIGENGVDMKANGYSSAAIKAYYDYKTNRDAYENVNSGIKSASDAISKKMFEGMTESFREGKIRNNFKNPVIRSIISNLNGKSYEELSGDERKAFNVAMIDESIRAGKINKEILPYVLKNRQELISGIEDEKYTSKLPSESLLMSAHKGESGATMHFRSALRAGAAVPAAFVDGLASIFGQDTGFSKELFEDADALFQEGEMRSMPQDIFYPDGTIYELQEDEFQVDGKGVKASDMVNAEYTAALQTARNKSEASAKRLPSTYMINISGENKDQKEMRNVLVGKIAAGQDVGTDDFGNNDVEVRYNKADDSFTLTSTLKTSISNFYDSDARRVSRTIPASAMEDVPQIANRVRKDTDQWAFNTENPQASSLNFHTTGFSNDQEREEVLSKIAQNLSPELAMELERKPHSIGYTNTEIKGLLDEQLRQTPNGEIKKFAEEFPKTYQAFTQGLGKFDVNLQSKHNQGYYSTISYTMNDKSVKLQRPMGVGRVLDYDNEYISSFQRQKALIDYLRLGYFENDPDVINKLREIENL